MRDDLAIGEVLDLLASDIFVDLSVNWEEKLDANDEEKLDANVEDASSFDRILRRS